MVEYYGKVEDASMSSITFETAGFAAAINKASKIAPTRGSAFDKAAGLVLEFDPSGTVPLATLRATNLDIFSMEWVNVTEWSGEAAQWRLPSVLVAQVIASLPIGTGKTVTFHSEPTAHSEIIHLTSGRTKAKFYPIDVSYYPEWGAFDPDDMFPAPDLGGRIEQVEWAASKDQPRLAGVYLDGQRAIATDTYRLACVPLVIPDLSRPVVIPAGLLGQTLRKTGDIQIGMDPDNNMLRIMPDEYTQMKTLIYDVEYPSVDSVIDSDFDTEVKVQRDAVLEVMNRTNAFSLGDRAAAFRMFFGLEEIAIYVLNEEMGSIGDVIEVPGQITHERFELKFTPKNIIEALSKSPNNEVTLAYNPNGGKRMVRIDGGSGYRAWVMSRIGESKSE